MNTSGNISQECDEILFNTNYEIFDSILSAAIAVFGLVYTFFGYRCFQAVMFLTGLIFGASIVYLICQGEQFFDQEISFQMTLGISAGIGVVCGFIALIVRYVGMFLQGFFMGSLLALAVILVIQIFYPFPTIWIAIGILFVGGCLFAVLTLAFQKPFLIISTAIFGSVLIMACVDYFLAQLYLFKYAWMNLTSSTLNELCWFAWLLVGAWLVLSVVGILLQWKVTAKNYDHTDVVLRRRSRKSVRTHLVREHRPSRRSTNPAPPVSPNVIEEEQPRIQEQPPSLDHEDIVITTDSDPPEFSVGNQEEYEADDPPPSYYECVELGVGEPVTGDRRSVIQTTAEVYSRRSLYLEPPSEGVQNVLMRQIHSGSGYSLNDARRSTLSERGSPGPTRSRNLRSSLNSRHRRSGSSRRGRENQVKKARTTNQKPKSPSRPRERNTSVPTAGTEGSSRNDMQSLLADSSRARSSRGAVAAHAERLRVAEDRRTSRQVQPTQ